MRETQPKYQRKRKFGDDLFFFMLELVFVYKGITENNSGRNSLRKMNTRLEILTSSRRVSMPLENPFLANISEKYFLWRKEVSNEK